MNAAAAMIQNYAEERIAKHAGAKGAAVTRGTSK